MKQLVGLGSKCSVSNRSHAYKIIDQRKFLSILRNNSGISGLPIAEAGFFLHPSDFSVQDIGIIQFYHNEGSRYSCVLTVGRCAWVSDFELQFLTHLIKRDGDGNSYICITSTHEVDYDIDSSILPVWISGELSRGPHSFHYGHFTVDYLSSIAFLEGTQNAASFAYIQGQPVAWQDDLFEAADIHPNIVTLYRPHPFGSCVILHRIKCAVCFLAPSLTPSNRRYKYNALIRRCEALHGSLYERVANRVFNRDRPLVMLSRFGMPNPRISNELELFGIARNIFPTASLIRPDMFAPAEFFCYLDRLRPIILSAGNSAVSPVLLLCRVAHTVLQLVPFTVDEVVSGNCAGYQDISDLRAKGCLLPVSCNMNDLSVISKNNTGGWNAEIRVDEIAFSNMLNSLVNQQIVPNDVACISLGEFTGSSP